MKRRLWLLLIGVVLVAAFLFLRDGESEHQRAIRQVIEAGAAAGEDGDPDALSQLIAADFRDRLGHDNKTIVRRVMSEMRPWSGLEITLDDLKIEVDQQDWTARATFRPRFQGNRQDSPEERAGYDGPEGRRFKLTLRRYAGQWLISRGEVVFSLIDAM